MTWSVDPIRFAIRDGQLMRAARLRRQARNRPVPLPVPFKDDEELRVYLGLPDTEEGRRIAAAFTPDKRREAAAMRAVENELKAGRVPAGVIVCTRGRRR